MLRTIPGAQIILPGTPAEFDILFRSAYGNTHLTYFRLSEKSHDESLKIQFGRAAVLRRGKAGTVVAVGPILSSVLQATQGMDVSILYYSTVAPFDGDTLRENCPSGVIAVVEPFYQGTLTQDIMSAVNGQAVRLLSIGVPRRFLTRYGKSIEHDEQYGLTVPQLRKRLKEFVYAEI